MDGDTVALFQTRAHDRQVQWDREEMAWHGKRSDAKEELLSAVRDTVESEVAYVEEATNYAMTVFASNISSWTSAIRSELEEVWTELDLVLEDSEGVGEKLDLSARRLVNLNSRLVSLVQKVDASMNYSTKLEKIITDLEDRLLVHSSTLKGHEEDSSQMRRWLVGAFVAVFLIQAIMSYVSYDK